MYVKLLKISLRYCKKGKKIRLTIVKCYVFKDDAKASHKSKAEMQYIVLIELSRNHLKEAPYRCNALPKSLILIPFSCKFITVNFIKMKLLKYPWQFFSKCFLTVISMK